MKAPANRGATEELCRFCVPAPQARPAPPRAARIPDAPALGALIWAGLLPPRDAASRWRAPVAFLQCLATWVPEVLITFPIGCHLFREAVVTASSCVQVAKIPRPGANCTFHFVAAIPGYNDREGQRAKIKPA